MLSRQSAPDQDALHRFRHVEPGTSERGIEQDDTVLMTPIDDLCRMMTRQIVPDQHKAHGRPFEAACIFFGVTPVAPAVPPFLGLLATKRRHRLQCLAQLLLEPRVQHGVGRPLDGLGADDAGRGSEQRQQLGRAATDILVRLTGRLSLRLPGRPWLRDRLVRPGLILVPDRNASQLAQSVRLLDQPLFSSACGSWTSTVPALRLRFTVPVSHQVRLS